MSIADQPPASATPARDPYAALRVRDFRLLLIGKFISSLGAQMISVAIGYELYVRTHAALALGFVGLAQIVPVLLLSLPAGYLADRHDRRHIVLIAQSVLAAGIVFLLLLSALRGPVPLIYLALMVMGVGNALGNPASTALVALVVRPREFANAATWSSSSWQLASVAGPALGGFVIALTGHATLVYVCDTLAVALYICFVAAIRARPASHGAVPREPPMRALTGGLSFLRGARLILAIITLDLFAVLLGGATTLLPVYALSILHVGAVGLGWLEATPSIGAVVVALLMAHAPPFRRAGWAMLCAVGGFGVATIVFGVSTNFWLSLLMLAILGGLDNISVVVRSTVLLTRTPDEMRGRVSAVNSLFVNASNQLGGFESGLAAALIGTVWAVVAGGAGTILVVALIGSIWPEVRRLGRLTDIGGVPGTPQAERKPLVPLPLT